MSILKDINRLYKLIKKQEKALKLWEERTSKQIVNKESIDLAMK